MPEPNVIADAISQWGAATYIYPEAFVFFVSSVYAFANYFDVAIDVDCGLPVIPIFLGACLNLCAGLIVHITCCCCRNMQSLMTWVSLSVVLVHRIWSMVVTVLGIQRYRDDEHICGGSISSRPSIILALNAYSSCVFIIAMCILIPPFCVTMYYKIRSCCGKCIEIRRTSDMNKIRTENRALKKSLHEMTNERDLIKRRYDTLMKMPMRANPVTPVPQETRVDITAMEVNDQPLLKTIDESKEDD